MFRKMKEEYIWNDLTDRYVLRKQKTGKCIERKFDREEKIQSMKNQAVDIYEPIYFESFENWTDSELQTSVFLGNHFYKAKDLYDYIYSNRGNDVIKDPIHGKELSAQEIKVIYKKNFEKYKGIERYKFDKKNIVVKNEYMNPLKPLMPDRSSWGFVRMSVEFDTEKYSWLDKHSILLGYVPLFINVYPLAYDEIPALDSASTSEVIISKITMLVEQGKLFEISESNKIIGVKTLHNLLKDPKDWLTYGYKHYKMVDVFTKNSSYFKLLQELEEYDS